MESSVILLSSYSPSLVAFRGSLIRRLVALGREVIACGPEDASAQVAAIGAKFEAVGPRRTSMNPAYDLLYAARLIQLFRRRRPSAVIAYTAKPVIWGCLSSWIVRVPTRVAMITGLGFAFGEDASRVVWTRRAVRWLYRVSLARATCIIFQNPDDLREFERLGLVERGMAHVVNGSGVELKHYSPISLPGNSTFLLIARLLADKGIREYVEAARQIRKSYPNARFLLVGWYDDNPNSLRHEEVDSWIKQGIIEFLGRLEDVRPAIAQADVFVLPSYREGTPRTVLEAMAMGRPIITTDVPGCRETVVEGVNGFLVPSRDADAVALAMCRFLAEPGLAAQMGFESQRLAESRFDAEVVAKAVVDAAGL